MHPGTAAPVPPTASDDTSGWPPSGPAPTRVGRKEWDVAIAALAHRQHGVLSREQLLTIGLSDSAIKHRLRSGRLHAVHPGVYAVGHALLAPRGWWMAAVLSCGPGALLSHVAAAALWGLVPGTPRVADVLTRRSPGRRPGVRGRRARRVPESHRTVRDGIPCTSVARTLLDLATCADERTLDRAVREAVDRRLFDRFAIEEILRSGRPGVVALRQAVSSVARDERDGIRTKSELERRFRDLLMANRFVMPSANVMVGTPWGEYEVDAFWPAQNQIVELDGWDSHKDRESFRRDHRRDADLSAAGHRVLRLSWDQVVVHPIETVMRMGRLVPRVELPGRPADPRSGS